MKMKEVLTSADLTAIKKSKVGPSKAAEVTRNSFERVL